MRWGLLLQTDYRGLRTRVSSRNHEMGSVRVISCVVWGYRSHAWRGNFMGKWPAWDMPGHVQRSIYSKRLSRGQHRLGCTRWGAHWRCLANTIEPSYTAAMRPFVKLLWPFVSPPGYRPAWRAYVLLLLVSLSSLFLTIAWSKEISETTRPIFTKFSALVYIWL